MAEKFNLLPKKQQGARRETKATKFAKRAAVASFIISLVIFSGGIATLYLLNNNHTQIKQDISLAKGQISALESAESGLVVSKDRAQKLSKLLGLRENEQIYRKYLNLYEQLPPSIDISRVELTDTTSQVTFIGTSSQDFSDFLENFILEEAAYNVIYFNSVGLDQNTGYRLVLEIH